MDEGENLIPDLKVEDIEGNEGQMREVREN